MEEERFLAADTDMFWRGAKVLESTVTYSIDYVVKLSPRDDMIESLQRMIRYIIYIVFEIWLHYQAKREHSR